MDSGPVRIGNDARGQFQLDAGNHLIPVLGFLPGGDPRVLGTIKEIRQRLQVGKGLLCRHNIRGGLKGREGAFWICSFCSFWLVKALVLAGRVEEAEEFFTETLKYVSPLGLLSEEVEPETNKMLGNFPQAFSNIGLINSALYLGLARGQTSKLPIPMGMEQT